MSQTGRSTRVEPIPVTSETGPSLKDTDVNYFSPDAMA